jgi:two-component system chemotaxis response regulator CheB
MYSTLTERGALVTLDALTLGAVDYATKPTGATDREAAAQQVREQLLPLVKLWGRRRLPRRTEPPAPAPRPTVLPTIRKPVDLVAIGVSTGGPDALTALLPRLPGNLPVPVVIVQHMPPVFTAMLAQRLDRRCELTVTEVTDPGPAEPGHVYLAPGGRHLAVQLRGGRLVLELNDDAPENSCRPAVDVLFRSAAAATDGRMLAAVLTGMGQDGLAGAEVVRRAGAEVIVQDEATSVVWSMPGVIARAGLASAVLPLAGVADAIAGRVRAFGRAPVVGRV